MASANCMATLPRRETESSGSLILVFLLKKLGFEALPENVFDVLEFDAMIASQMVG